MRRVFRWSGVLSSAVAMVVIVPALAANAAKEIHGYSSLSVSFAKDARKCGFSSLDPFQQALRKDLSGIGINLDGTSIVSVNLQIGGVPHGALGPQCTIDVSLNFWTMLAAANIRTDNPAMQQAADRLRSFHVNLYSVSAFAVSPTPPTVAGGRDVTQAEMEVLKVIGDLVGRFNAARSH
jgi:hypothetical protein